MSESDLATLITEEATDIYRRVDREFILTTCFEVLQDNGLLDDFILEQVQEILVNMSDKQIDDFYFEVEEGRQHKSAVGL